MRLMLDIDHLVLHFHCSAFEDTLKHPDLSIDMALATIRLATQNDRLPAINRAINKTINFACVSRYDLAFSGIRLLSKRYQNLPDLSQVRLLHLVTLYMT